MLHDSCMFCTGLGRRVPYALGVSYRITDARRGFASVKLMVDLGPCVRLTSFVGLWVEGLRLGAGGLSCAITLGEVAGLAERLQVAEVASTTAAIRPLVVDGQLIAAATLHAAPVISLVDRAAQLV